MIGLLSEVNVEALCVLGIEIVRGSKELNEFMIVVDKVGFRKIKIIPYPEINKDVSILMVQPKSSFHVVQCLGCVNWVFCQVEEIKQSTDRPDKLAGCTMRSIWNPDVDSNTKQKPTNLVMLGAGHTRKMGYAPEEEPNVVIRRKTAATGIDFGLTTSLL